ncbi:MAG: hypothetical protein IJT66_03605 [Clostridia bacterium]|nr:hypothetical protein [Clostridia bacterium]
MKSSLLYSLFDPPGNITALAEMPRSASVLTRVAETLMQKEPTCEQVGFLSSCENADIALRMAGGEFCGNATMCAAVSFAENQGIFRGDVIVWVFGTGNVHVRVLRLQNAVWQATVDMPAPLAIETVYFPEYGSFPIVRFEGISHIILEDDALREQAEILAPAWCRQLDAAALGLMFWNRKTGTLAPLVTVPSANTLCWESSCASGTTAVTAYCQSQETKSVKLSLIQPGGTLQCKSEHGNYALTGSVRLLHTAVLSFPL